MLYGLHSPASPQPIIYLWEPAEQLAVFIII